MPTRAPDLENTLATHTRHLRNRGYVFDDEAATRAIEHGLKAAESLGPTARRSEQTAAATGALHEAMLDYKKYPAMADVTDDPFSDEDIRRQRTYSVACTALTHDGEQTRMASVVVADMPGLVREACQRRGFGERMIGRYTLENHQVRMKRVEEPSKVEGPAIEEAEVLAPAEGEQGDDDPDGETDAANDAEDVEVDAEPSEDGLEAVAPAPLPDDLPGPLVASLQNAGITTMEGLAAYATTHASDFTAIDGVGAKSSAKLAALIPCGDSA